MRADAVLVEGATGRKRDVETADAVALQAAAVAMPVLVAAVVMPVLVAAVAMSVLVAAPPEDRALLTEVAPVSEPAELPVAVVACSVLDRRSTPPDVFSVSVAADVWALFADETLVKLVLSAVAVSVLSRPGAVEVKAPVAEVAPDAASVKEVSEPLEIPVDVAPEPERPVEPAV